MAGQNVREVGIQRVRGTHAESGRDCLAVEEPLEIRLGGRAVSLTMRTPGGDADLAVGFLVGEGILRDPNDVAAVRAADNTIQIDLAPGVAVAWDRLDRHFYTTSSCGVCGKTSLAAVQAQAGPLPLKGEPRFGAATIHALPGQLRDAQAVFARTGGLHAAALFDGTGKIVALCEDVGRHNAVDKLIGAEFLAGRLPLSRLGMIVSGRASFELVQKTVMAGVPLLAAVGAPSSLAVDLAAEFDVTLLGFVRDDRFNVYAAPWRIREAALVTENDS